MKNLKDILNDFIARFADDNEFYNVRCRVLEIDEVLNTCDVETITGKSVIDDVQLSTNIGATLGSITIPTIDSTVIVGFNSKNDAFYSYNASDFDDYLMEYFNFIEIRKERHDIKFGFCVPYDFFKLKEDTNEFINKTTCSIESKRRNQQ